MWLILPATPVAGIWTTSSWWARLESQHRPSASTVSTEARWQLVRCAQLAVGRNGRVHVAWHGSKPLTAKRVPMCNTRANANGTAFETQRSVSGNSEDLDGGTVCGGIPLADVAVAWHANGARLGEGNLTVYLSRSSDNDGVPLLPHRQRRTHRGRLRMLRHARAVRSTGALHVLYRAATMPGTAIPPG